MRFQSLDAWLEWQQTLNPKTIDLGLDRVLSVYQALHLDCIADRVITVAGTNGKGSTVAYYEAWLTSNGYKVASYSSPHLLAYNERIRFAGQPVPDNKLCQAFEKIDQARGDIALTYFEFGTLTALLLMSQEVLDFAILEVGLGGKLDAVNIIDADLAHITPIGLDHQDWLGDTRELIGFEKAGILRQNKLAVLNDRRLPATVEKEVNRLGCKTMKYGKDYRYQNISEQMIEWSTDERLVTLMLPLEGNHQAHNLCGVMAGLTLLNLLEGKTGQEIADGFNQVSCPGRLQQIETRLDCQVWIDVGHNEDAASALAAFLKKYKAKGRVVVLFGMLADKTPNAFVSKLEPVVDQWWLLSLGSERGLSSQQLNKKLMNEIDVDCCFNNIDQVVEHAQSKVVPSLNNKDIILITGSFVTVETLLLHPFFKG